MPYEGAEVKSAEVQVKLGTGGACTCDYKVSPL